MADQPSKAGEFADAAEDAGLVDGLHAGSIDAFKSYLELSGSKVEELTVKTLSSQ